jgi:beta-phosphoglucomutase-like phosphatase (HAD superfamily)
LSRPGLPDLVIFDCDGVLIDSETIAARTEAAYLNEIGFAITTDDIMSRYVGLSMSAMIADIEMRYAQRLPADFGDGCLGVRPPPSRPSWSRPPASRPS